MVQNGAVDAVSTDDVILTGMIIQDPTLKLVGDQLTQEPYGAGIKKGDAQMVEFVNGVFKGMKDNGTWTKLFDTWIGKYTSETGEPPAIRVPRPWSWSRTTRRCSTSSPSTGPSSARASG